MNSVLSPIAVQAPAGHSHASHASHVQPSAAVHAAMQRSAVARQFQQSHPSRSVGNSPAAAGHNGDQYAQFASRQAQMQAAQAAYYNRPSRANSRDRSTSEQSGMRSSEPDLGVSMPLLRPRVTRVGTSPDFHQQRQHAHHSYHQHAHGQHHHQTQNQYPTLLQQQRQHHLQRQQPQFQQNQQNQQMQQQRQSLPSRPSSRHASPAQQPKPQQPQQQERRPIQPPSPAPVEWRVAVDPKSKRQYYYHPVTRQTTWKKPQELVDKEKHERAQFFASMESNIRAKLRAGNWFRDSLTSRPDDLDDALAEEDTEDDDGELSSSTSTSSRSSWSSAANAMQNHSQTYQSQSQKLPQSNSLPTSPETDSAKSSSVAAANTSNQDDNDTRAADALAMAAAKPPLLFRTLSSYETPVVAETKKLANGRVISMPSPIQERVLLAASDDLPRSSDLESYTRPDLSTLLSSSDSAPSSSKGAGETEAETGAARGIARQPLRRRSNSTSTIFVRMGTMNAPDQDTTIQCVATVLRAHLMEAQASPIDVDSKFEIFVNRRDQRANATPALKEIGSFIKHVFSRAQMESECIIMSLIYVERLLKATMGSLQLQPANWRSILFCSMVMASKVWDDLSMCNADFSKIWPELSLKEINELELTYLGAVEYNVRVSAVSYAKYYFHLRSMCASMGMLKSFDESAPLNLDGARKMQVLSEEYQERSKLLPAPSRRRSVTITTTAQGRAASNGSGGSDRSLSSKWSPTASLEQLVHMQVRGAGGSALLSSMHRLSTAKP